jgi:hypothetical protein
MEQVMEYVMEEEKVSCDQDLISSTQVLRLPEGIYSFTAPESGAAALRGDLILPAMQVGLAPVRSAGRVEFLAGASIVDRWLAQDTDMIIVRITGGDAALFLTSVRLPDSPGMAVDVRRLTADPGTAAHISGQVADNAGEPLNPLPVRILTHIRNVGDLHFLDCWAGWIGQKLPIEAFAVLSAGDLATDSIEYCGLTAEGIETAWVGGPALCGSKGFGAPMLGFAIRLKPELAPLYECIYSGRFVSGAIVGPLEGGVVCCSTIPGDALEGIDLCIAERRVQESLATVSA